MGGGGEGMGTPLFLSNLSEIHYGPTREKL